MKKYLILAAIIGFLGLCGTVYATSFGGGGSTGSITSISASTATATSTLTTLYPNATASSTLTAGIEGASSALVQMCNTASSSVAYLDIKVFYSPQDATSTSITWFQETDSTASTGLITHTPLTRVTSLATTSTNYLCTSELISSVGAKQVKIQYGVRSATTSIWLSVVPR